MNTKKMILKSKKGILLFIAVLFVITVSATNGKYYMKMGMTLRKFNKCEDADDYQKLANEFKVISNVEKQEWLPLYYEAQCYILMSFVEENSEKRDEYLEKSNEIISSMIEMVPEESEVHALQAFYYTGKLVINPQERGQKYSALTGQAAGKALSLEPENPRARYLKISNEIGTARFFGSDVSQYCEQAQELVDEWDNYELKTKIHPRWGKAQVQGIVNSCGE